MTSIINNPKKFARLALAGLVLATGTVAASVMVPTAAMARGGGGGGGGGGGEGGGEGMPAGMFFREDAALKRAIDAAARRNPTRPPSVKIVRPWIDRDCDRLEFVETKGGPRYRCHNFD